MTKILFIEDEYNAIKDAIDYLIEIENYSINYEIEETCNKYIDNLKPLYNYDIIYIDVKLRNDSRKDGVDFAKYISETNADLLERIVITTGNIDISIRLNEIGLNNIRVTKKPLTFNNIANDISLLD